MDETFRSMYQQYLKDESRTTGYAESISFPGTEDEVRADLKKETAEKIREVPYTFALFGPDLWFMYQPWKRREGPLQD